MNILKRALSILLSIAVIGTALLSGATMPTFAVEGELKGNIEAYASNTTEFAGGSGTEADPYLISTKEHLNNVRNYLDANFKMINDIEFTDADFASGGAFYNDGAGWQPIGNKLNPFKGNFDGNGYAIKNLYIKINSNSASNVYAGLFGYASNGTIKNLGMEDSDISATSTSTSISTYSYTYAGGIVGEADRITINNCYNTGAVTATTTTTSTATHSYAGGIVGYADYSTTITNCYNTGDVTSTATYSYAGGIVGRADDSTITDCYNTGDATAIATSTSTATYSYAGGIVGGAVNSTINNCYNTGAVTATSSYSYAGGIVGGADDSTTINNCYNTGDVTSTPTSKISYAGGIVGRADDSTITNCYNTGDVTATTTSTYSYAGGIVGGADDSTTITDCYNTGAVISTYLYSYAGGIVGEAHNITITNCYNTGDVTATATYSSSYAGGIVGCAHNITITDCYNTGAVISTDLYSYAGGIVGYAVNSTITDCYNTGDVTATSSYFYAGGIVGGADDSTITDCYNTGAVTATATSSSFYAGGIVGYAVNSTITDCYNTGAVTATSSYSYAGGIVGRADDSTINNCYNTGDVTSTATYSYAGGIVGRAYNSTITDCYNTGDVTSTATYSYAGGIVGHADDSTTITNCYYLDTILKGVGRGLDTCTKCTLEEMKKQETFAGFDFEEVWFIGGEDYKFPQLRDNQHYKTLSIEITTKPDKLIYLEGDELDLSGIVVTAYYNNNTNSEITDYEISGYDSTPGTKVITVTYGGKTASFTVEVEAKSFVSIEITTKPDKLIYLEGDEFDPTGIVVMQCFNNNTSEEITDYEISGYDSTPGTKVITVTYGGKTETFTVEVEAKSFVSIEITTKPDKLIYLEGDEFDPTGIVVMQCFNNNTSEEITDYEISGYDSTPGTKVITVTYEGKTATFTVEVNFRVPSEITSTKYDIEEDILSKVTAGTTVFDMLSELNEGEYCKVFKGNNEVSEDTTVGTGMTVKIMDGDEEKATYTVIVLGDTNGDGKINSTDFMQVRKQYLGLFVMNDAQGLSSDVNGDGKINSTDFMQIRKHFLGLFNLYE